MLKRNRQIYFTASDPARIAENWNNMWSDGSESIKQKISRPSILKNIFKSKESLTYLANNVFVKELGRLEGKTILEAGSGTGLLSLEMARKKAKVVLLDISKTALEISKHLFSVNNKQCSLINGDIFHLPFRQSSYDVVWNVGVLEHFCFNDQVIILKEMMRVCKNDGIVITVNPSNRRSLYTFSKDFSERRNLWTIGYEEPIGSLKEQIIQIKGAYLAKEYSVGFLYQFKFLHYLFYKVRILQKMVSAAAEFLNRIFNVFNNFPGCFLVSIVRKNR